MYIEVNSYIVWISRRTFCSDIRSLLHKYDGVNEWPYVGNDTGLVVIDCSFNDFALFICVFICDSFYYFDLFLRSSDLFWFLWMSLTWTDIYATVTQKYNELFAKAQCLDKTRLPQNHTETLVTYLISSYDMDGWMAVCVICWTVYICTWGQDKEI